MAKYRKKPVVVEAIQYDTPGSVSKIMEWAGSHGINNSPEGLYIHTLEGSMLARKGDYVIKGIKGEFYSCRKDIFKKTYELVEEEDCNEK